MTNLIIAGGLGLIQGITEFLPISSTGHLILFSKYLSLPANDFWSSFKILIQLGSVVAVLLYYRQDLWRLGRYWWKLLLAFLPTAISGFIFYPLIKNFFLHSELVVVWSLLLGGIVLWLLESFLPSPKNSNQIKEEVTEPKWWQALLIGVCQSLALIPGVSRSAASIAGGLALGLPRRTIVKFSFSLAIPTILSATLYDIYQTPQIFSTGQTEVLVVGFVVSGVVSWLAIHYLLKYLQTNDFKIFAWYRIILSLLWLFFLL